MARDFRRAVRDQPFLLPPDVREWLPASHLAWFVIDVLEQLDLSAFEGTARLGGAGRAPFDPRTLLGVLIYGYAHGQRSSRQLERLCEVDVAFRVLCGNEVPDHTVLARFRQRHQQRFSELFTQVLLLCSRAGLGRLGVVALDGTKIKANASTASTVSESRLRELLAGQVEAMVSDAEATDAAEDVMFGGARGDELPEPWRDPTDRAARIRQALDDIAAERDREQPRQAQRQRQAAERVARAQENLDRQRARARGRAERWETRRAAAPDGKVAGKRPTVPPEEQVKVGQAREQLARAQAALQREQTDPDPRLADGRRRRSGWQPSRNATDPDSRPMPTRNGFIQGYNAQAAVTDDQIILATKLTQDTGDIEQFVPMMRAAEQAAELIAATRSGDDEHDTGIGVVVADAGYNSAANLTADGPDRLIALGKRSAQDKRAVEHPAQGPPPEDADPRQLMDHRLRTDEGMTAYRRRGVTVEPVFGHLKDIIGLRQFSRRGLNACAAELDFAAAVANLLKLHKATG